MLIARKAGLAEFLQYTSGTAADVVRADAWLAICTLADSIASNARAIRDDQHDKVVDSSLLWARAIDLCNAWMRVAEEHCCRASGGKIAANKKRDAALE